MEKFGCPNKFIMIIRQLHDAMVVKVLNDGDRARSLPHDKRRKTRLCSCPNTFPLLEYVFFFSHADRCLPRLPYGLHIRFRADSGLFNLGQLKAVTKVKETVVEKLLLAQRHHRAEDAKGMRCFSRACNNFGLTILKYKENQSHVPACPRTALPGSTHYGEGAGTLGC